MATLSKKLSMLLVLVLVASSFFPLFTGHAGAKVTGRANLIEAEPNNSYAQANEIFAGDHVSGKLNWTDGDDVFKINVTAGKVLNVTLYLIDYTPGTPWDYDVDFAIDSPNKWIIVNHWWQTSRTDAGSMLIYADGMHYIWLWANGTTATHTKETRYVLSVNAQDPPTQGVGQTFGTIDTKASYTDAWYKLTIPAGHGVHVEMTPPNSGDFDLYLYATGGPLATYFPGISCPYDLNESYINKTGAAGKETVGGLSMDGTYYVKVYGWSGMGQFTLDVSEDTMVGDDGDSTKATATTITDLKADRITMSSVSQSFDTVDWYKIHLNSSEYVNAYLTLISGSSKVDLLFGFYDQWLTPQSMLWQYTTVTGGTYDSSTNLLDSTASITTAPYSTGASVPGDYYFFVKTAWRDQTGNGDDFVPVDAFYRIQWDLPNYGVINKSLPIPPITMNEDATYNSLNLSDYFMDREGDTMTFSSTFAPAVPNVTVTIDPVTSRVTIKPNQYFNNGGKAMNLSFKATDASADWGVKSATLNTTLTIKHVNHAPVVQMALASITIPEDSVNQTTPSEMNKVFKDPDGDHLIYRILGAEHVLAAINPTNTVMTLGPVHQWFGSENITVQAEDPSGSKVNSTFTVTVRHVNHPPTGKGAKTLFYHNMTEDTTDKSLNVATLFEDPDLTYASDSLRYSIEYTPEHPEVLHITVSLDTSNNLVLVPKANWTGVEEIPVTARDLSGAKVLIIVQVSVINVNDPPVIKEVAPPLFTVTMKEGEMKKFEVTKVVDPDADTTLTYRWYLNNALLPVMTSATYYNLETDYTNISSKPASGNYTLKVVVSDGIANATWSWTVQVQDQNRKPTAPTINEPLPTKSFTVGTTITMRAGGATDADLDTLTYSWHDDTTNQNLGSGPSILWKPSTSGQHKVTVTVSDGKGGSASTSITLTIKKKAATGMPMMTLIAIIAVVLVLVIVIVVVVLMMKRKKKEPQTAKDVADNYEAQMWGNKPGARPSTPPQRPAEPPAYREPANTSAEPPVEDVPEEKTWTPGGASTVEEAPEQEVPRPGPPQ
jgi:hypothetical protein